ncbi:MAG: hypothetical protein QOH12_2566 [Solirubrobacteraceae bacterium]|jgi:hypothetical protein|nr:hypothetical protein [Solirubrobacteraceae bacterium]
MHRVGQLNRHGPPPREDLPALRLTDLKQVRESLSTEQPVAEDAVPGAGFGHMVKAGIMTEKVGGFHELMLTRLAGR